MAELSGNLQLEGIAWGSQPPTPQSYLHSAQQLMKGVEALAASGIDSHNALILVCGFTAEAVLKGIVAKNTGEAIWGYDLGSLWTMAQKVTELPPAPDWIAQLNVFHWKAPEPNPEDKSAEGTAKTKLWKAVRSSYAIVVGRIFTAFPQWCRSLRG